MSQQLQMRILRREQIELTDLYIVIADSRCKRACLAISSVKSNIEHLDELIDSEVTEVPQRILEQTLAQANKKWFAFKRNEILSTMNGLSVAMEQDIINLADAPVAVEEATDLNGNLQKLFSSTLKGFEDITKHLSALESTTISEEILAFSAELRRSWINLRIMLNNQIVTPSTFALEEEARDTILSALGAMVEKESLRMQKEA